MRSQNENNDEGIVENELALKKLQNYELKNKKMN